jgi:uncharacterized protein YegL
MTRTILILAANPNDTAPLRLDQEVREIDNGLERARRRGDFILKQKWATRPVDVRRAMLDFSPNIVHFCGHGSGEEGIAFEDEAGKTKLVDADTLAEFFQLFANKVECVVLNACYSELQAEALAKHIPHVIGMKKAIGDTAAIEFAVAFYDALGAGESIEFAYKLACNAIRWSGMQANLTPVLKTTRRLGKNLIKKEEPSLSFRLTPKLACLLLLDISGSMSGPPIHSLQVGLQLFVDDLLNNSVTLERVELAVITFGSHVAILRDFCPVHEFVVPDLSAAGTSAMGEAVELGLDLIKRRKQDYQSQGVPYYQPIILLFTDGEPTDHWQLPVNRLHKESALRRVRFIAVGLDGADVGFLKRVSPPGTKPIMLKQLRFSEMFLWLSQSIRSVSSTTPNDVVHLNYPPEWEEE